jgi:hypothetical protein
MLLGALPALLITRMLPNPHRSGKHGLAVLMHVSLISGTIMALIVLALALYIIFNFLEVTNA